ncbi:ribosome biogenesis GTPase A [Terribacillus aidingensis]|uniref:Ribosome biogenesis GTPase A n=1 Tax=Terribacillus aidingensis TaxID=586416 RepID=A0A285NPK9_9BACI|nr:ribosome biogenesis GTPase YlqF [Terribacillus aidingensis]SNZ09571.1 ribosome biogenesis GTPase A [Terribacillus aidingensis]
MTIQWFPGHMAKARREVEEKLKLVDFVIELVDARAPEASQNPMLRKVLGNKPKMVVLMKKDLADKSVTDAWIRYYEEQGTPALAVNADEKGDVQRVIQRAHDMHAAKRERWKRKGLQNPPPGRAMIIGIPNVGKSTLINRLASKKIAKTGDRPGVTTQQQWIKVKKDFELLDTPGILWPKFEDPQVGLVLAAIGTIKDQILPMEEVATFILSYLKEHYPAQLSERYGIDNLADIEVIEMFTHIGRIRGALEGGGMINYEKTYEIVIRDLRSKRIANVTFEKPAAE